MVNFLKIKQLKTDCLRTFKDISSFMDSDLKDLRYMRKSFGYLVYNSIKYIVKHNGKNATVVNKEDKFVSCKPFEESYHGIDENGKMLNISIPYDDRERYDIIYLDDIDKGEPFVTEHEKVDDEIIKKRKQILLKRF